LALLTKLASDGMGKPKHVAGVAVTMHKLFWAAILDCFLITSTTEYFT